jgi:hypothetical protein
MDRLGVAKPMPPDVTAAFDRMAAEARSEAGLYLSGGSGFTPTPTAGAFETPPKTEPVAVGGSRLPRRRLKTSGLVA